MRSVRKLATAGLGAAAVGIISAATAWACVAGPVAFTSTINAKAGEEITVTGVDFRNSQPVLVRFNALDGPVLADLGAPKTARGQVEGKVTVPQGTAPGSYVLVFTQTGPDGKFSQTPVRTMLNVVGEGAPVVAATSAAPDARPTGLVTSDNGVSGGTLALVGLGVAGVGMFVAGIAALFAGRRSSAPEAAKVRS